MKAKRCRHTDRIAVIDEKGANWCRTCGALQHLNYISGTGYTLRWRSPKNRAGGKS